MSEQQPNQPVQTFDPADIEKNKVISGIAYIIFFLPLIVCPDSPFGRFHTNQALVLFLFSLGGSIVFSIIPIIGWFVLLPIYSIVILVFAIIGLVGALGGKATPLPVIGKIKILK